MEGLADKLDEKLARREDEESTAPLKPSKPAWNPPLTPPRNPCSAPVVPFSISLLPDCALAASCWTGKFAHSMPILNELNKLLAPELSFNSAVVVAVSATKESAVIVSPARKQGAATHPPSPICIVLPTSLGKSLKSYRDLASSLGGPWGWAVGRFSGLLESLQQDIRRGTSTSPLSVPNTVHETIARAL